MDLQITNTAITMGSKRIATRNVSQARAVEREIYGLGQQGLSILFVIVARLLPGPAIFITFVGHVNGWTGWMTTGWSMIAGLILMTLMRRRMKPAIEYGVELTTNAGTENLIWASGPDASEFIDRVTALVFKAMEGVEEGNRVSYTVNVDRRNITSNVTNNVTNNYDYSVNFNRYEGLQPDQLAFLQGEFTKNLAALMEKTRNTELESELKALVEAMNRKENPGRLQKMLDRFKMSADLADLAGSVAEMVPTVVKGVSMVIGAASAVVGTAI